MDKMVNSLLSAGVNPMSTPVGQLIGKILTNFVISINSFNKNIS